MRKAVVLSVVVLIASTFFGSFARAEDSDFESTKTEQTSDSHAQVSGAERSRNIALFMAQQREAKANGEAAPGLTSNKGSTILSMVQGLGLVIGIFLIGVHVYKKYVIKNEPFNSRRIKIIERAPLSNKAALVLAEIEGQRILVGIGAEGITMTKLEPAPIRLEESYEEGSEELWRELATTSV